MARGYAADALRVTWHLARGGTREMVLRLAEAAMTVRAFAEHLRWHAEGLDRFLAGLDDGPVDASGEPPAGSSVIELSYEPMDNQIAVSGIELEALNIQLPTGTQLKLLAAPLRWPGAPVTPDARLDPITRSRYARRAIARLQARWGLAAVHRAELTDSRLPERAFRLTEPDVALQLESGGQGGGRSNGRALTDSFSPLMVPSPMWLLEPAAPVAILTPRRGGRRVLSLSGAALRGETAIRAFASEQLRIVRSGGPWKLTDPSLLVDGPPLQRDYYHLETEDGKACLVYWDRVTDAWFLQGIFD